MSAATRTRPSATASAMAVWAMAVLVGIAATANASASDGVSPGLAERQRYDGWYNNLANPAWGAVDSHLSRKTPPSYSDGVYAMGGTSRPSPRTLSQAFMKGVDGLGSVKNRTALTTFFGQLVSAEILQASEQGCPIELAPIAIDQCDEMYDPECVGHVAMPFQRAQYDAKTGQSPNNPREQVNMVTSWIDGSFVYSTKEAWVNAMRSFRNGTFRTRDGDADDPRRGLPPLNKERLPMENQPSPSVLRMESPERMFILGDGRTNQNPAFLALGIVFYRWHNVQAALVQEQHPDWLDEDIFQAARRRVIATMQSVILYEYLPALVGEPAAAYTGYKADVHPGISHIFQSAAFRFGHTTIPPGIYKRTKDCTFLKTRTGGPAMRLCSTWWDSQDEITNDSIEQMMLGLSSQIGEREDAVFCSDVRNNLFGPMEFSRRDLAALNIMRGRDHGLPDYNTVRKCNNLPVITDWGQINPTLNATNPEIFFEMARLYGDLNDIDLYVGGMLESVDGPGPLFSKIIKDQFERIRDADRFWFENQELSLLSTEDIEYFRSLRFSDVIRETTNIGAEDMQDSVFFWHAGDPCPQPMQLNASQLEPCVFLRGYDYFQGSEVAYIYGCILLCAFPLLTACAAYGVVKHMNRRRRRMKQIREENNNGKKGDKIHVKEWLHQSARRPVKIRFGPEQAFYLLNRKGEKLRTVSVKDVDSLVCEVTQDDGRRKPMALVRVLKDHDLVLEFSYPNERKKFLAKLENFLQSNKKQLETVPVHRDLMLANAETKERRRLRLEHFFREAYAITFGMQPGARRLDDASPEVIMVMRTTLSKKEFAAALGMKEGDLFVQKMFNIVDRDGDDRISFQEFLDTIVCFSRGRTDDKLRIIFDMCDNDRNGSIDKAELSELLNSLVDIAKTPKLSDSDVSDLINSMFRSAGFEDKDSLSYEDFKTMMKEFKGDFLAIGLDCKGAKLNYLDSTTNVARVQSFDVTESVRERHRNPFMQRVDACVNYLEENRQHIFIIFVFYVITFALFIDRFVFYSYLSEHLDLRHVMGVGIAITRGSASALSFCYCLLLLTMSRNLITKMKEHSLHQYIPLDSHLQFHKLCAYTALFFTILHTAGHLVNFYHISTQPVEHLRCLSKELSFASDAKPDIGYWLFQTLTGLTGVALYVIVVIIFVFAQAMVRKRAYSFFWITHQLYVLLYVLSVLHGLARLTAAPRFWLFLIVPGVIYAIDKIATLRTRYMKLDIIETELLPSDVLKIKFYRPPNMKVLSGQWIRLSCTAIQPEEFHSLTLTNAPHEDFLSVHVKAHGPWTWKLRNFFDKSINDQEEDKENPPKIRIEGPFGGGNQDWYKFEIAVMVGGGIGVTPYASILNDLAFGTSTNRYSGVACKKVYFLWICPSHKYFEWFIDVLREVEEKDVTNVLEMHIFITQFFHKFDLRTTMLYICENHFQRVSSRSMFTGLKAVNHFGRPDVPSFLKFVQRKHSYVSKVGVFSCGPGPMTSTINSACESVNKQRKLPYFIHHYENFG